MILSSLGTDRLTELISLKQLQAVQVSAAKEFVKWAKDWNMETMRTSRVQDVLPPSKNEEPPWNFP